MAKQIAVRIAGSPREAQNLTIQPGTTSQDILRQLGLVDYMLSAKNSDTYFGDDEVVYPLVADGELLYATSRAEVGVI